MPEELEGEQLPQENKEGSIDLSLTNDRLGELINIIKSEQEIRQKEKELQEKKEKEEFEKKQKQDKETSKTVEEKEKTFEENIQILVENSKEQTLLIQSIDTGIKELVFLDKLGFVGLGLGIALCSVVIFQNSFKR